MSLGLTSGEHYIPNVKLMWSICQKQNIRYIPSWFGVIAKGALESQRMQIRRRHVDVIKWKQSPRYWPFVRGINRSPVNSPHKGEWRGAWIFSLICVWINGWIHNHDAGDLIRHRAHYDVTVMKIHSTLRSNLFPMHSIDATCKSSQTGH